MVYIIEIDDEITVKSKKIESDENIISVCKEERQKILDKCESKNIDYCLTDNSLFVNVVDKNNEITGESIEMSFTIEYDINYEWPQNIKIKAKAVY